MSKPRTGNITSKRPMSAVSPADIAEYRRVPRPRGCEEEHGALKLLFDDLDALLKAGDAMPAAGAAIALIDRALTIAATPSATPYDRGYKEGFFFGPGFCSTMRSIGQGHVALLARAAVLAELASSDARDEACIDLHPGRATTTGPTSRIPRKRLEAYARAASRVGPFGDLPASIVRISADMAILEREGRTDAAEGAARAFDGAVRSLCAIAARSEEDAAAKIASLTSLRRFYRSGIDGSLMTAIIDAAIAFENEGWPLLPAPH